MCYTATVGFESLTELNENDIPCLMNKVTGNFDRSLTITSKTTKIVIMVE